MKHRILEMVIDGRSFEVIVDTSTEISGKVVDSLPLAGSVVNVQGEIYFLTELTVPYSLNDAKEEFEAGDLAYWISPDGSMKAIALFYGNTVYKDGKKPRAYSPCIKIGSIKNIDQNELKKIRNNSSISLNLLNR